MKRRDFTAGALTAAGGLVLAGRRPALAADTVRVGVASVYPTYSIFFATKELGYYKDAGLDVTIQTFRGGPASQEALAAGAVDICTILPTAAALAIQKGVKEKIVAMYVPVRAAGWYIMVMADSPIKTLADLNGKTVGVTQIGSLTDFWVQRVAKDAHITVTSVPLGGGVEAGLRSKKVDAAILWPLGSYKGLVHHDLRAVANLRDALPPTISEGVAASDDLVVKRPDVLRRWLASTSRGLIYMQQHEAWTVAFLKRYFEDQDTQAVEMVYSDFLKSIDPAGVMHADWEKTSLQLADPNIVASLPPADQVFSSTFTPIKAN